MQILSVSDDLTKSLFFALLQNEILDQGGVTYACDHQVDRFLGLKVEVYSREHPPPHFRVTYQWQSAVFAIKDCELLAGRIKCEHVVRKWQAENKPRLIEIWNNTRPADCSVGLYREQCESRPQ